MEAFEAFVLVRFPAPLVFDHLGHLPQPGDIAHPAFGVISRLIDRDRAWVKISGAYIDTKLGLRHTQTRQGLLRPMLGQILNGSIWLPKVSLDVQRDWVHSRQRRGYISLERATI
jgi:hypothetical protein